MMRTARTCVSNTASASIANLRREVRRLSRQHHGQVTVAIQAPLIWQRMLLSPFGCLPSLLLRLRCLLQPPRYRSRRAGVSADADEVASSGDGDGSWSPGGSDGEPISSLATSAAQAVRQARAFTSGCRDGPPAKQRGVGGGSRRDPGPALRSDPTPSSRGCGDG